MARKSREEKVIEHTESTIEDLEKLYNHDGRAVVEYNYLTKEYKKLLKRSNKIINMNDNAGKDMLQDTEKLKDNVDYTIQLAKKKIMYNIEEHRKTKEILATHSQTDKDIIKRLRRELRDVKQYVSKLESDLNKNTDVVHQFEENTDSIVKSKDINSDDIKNYSFDSILNKQIESSKQENTTFTVAKLSINDFDNIKQQLAEINSDKKAILKVLYKFFYVSLGKHNITYYYTDNIFYFLFPECDIDKSKSFLSKVNVPRKLSNIIFTFSIGVVQFDVKNDTLKTLNAKCTDANLKAIQENNGKSNIVYT